jgi:phosphoribosylamine--glycine ligase
MGDPIEGIEAATSDGALVFHAATRRADGGWQTAGGRVLAVVGEGRSLDDARATADRAAAAIAWAGAQRRHDIGRGRVPAAPAVPA